MDLQPYIPAWIPFGSFSESNDKSSTIIELSNKPTEDEISRIENIQMVIAAALISAYFTTATGSQSPFEGAELHLQILSIFSLFFLIAKIITVTIRPFSEFSIIDFFDRLFLPFTFMSSLLIGVVVIGLSIIEIEPVDLVPIGVHAETGLALIVIVVVSALYGWWVNRNMASLGTSMPEHSLTVESGPAGSTLPLTLKNNTGKTLSPKEIILIVNSPDGVDVNIESARELEDDVWHPLVPLPDDSESQIGVNFSRAAGKNEVTNEEVKISVNLNGETQEIHTAKLRI